ncbi:MAG: ABC transporter permease [Acidimicrobiales bacterium]
MTDTSMTDTSTINTTPTNSTPTDRATAGTSAAMTRSPGTVPWRPSFGRLARLRYSLEMRAFRRVREEVVFTFALPIMLLSLFALIFGGEIENTGVDVSQYFVAGMLASTGLTVGFQSLAGQLALEQSDGTLKRLSGTPMPKAAYMAGKVGLVATVAFLQAAVMFALGVALFNVSLPDGRGWALLSAVLVLNLTIWTLLGLAFSRVIRNPRAGAAVAVPPALILQFISGVYITFDSLPSWLQTVASFFPLRWAALGIRQALLPTEFQVAEPGGTWQTGTMLLILGGWLVASGALAGLLFRWRVQE